MTPVRYVPAFRPNQYRTLFDLRQTGRVGKDRTVTVGTHRFNTDRALSGFRGYWCDGDTLL